MIPSCSSPGIAKILLLATFFSCCVLTAAPQSIEFADFKDERHSQPTGSDGSSQQQPIDSVGQINGQGRRAVEPEASSNIIPGTTLSMNRKFTSYWNSSVLSASSSSSESSGGMPFLITDQPILSLTVEPGPTASDIAALAGVIEGLLNGIDPLETPTVIREITYEAVAVAPSVQAITSDIISAEGRIEANEIQALEALETVESLFEGLDSEIGSVLHDVIRGVTSGFPATASDSGNLASEVIKKASTTPQASETTIFPVPINSAPVATPAFSLTTVPSSDASQAITSPILTTRSVVGSVSKGTVVGATTLEDCPSAVTSTVFLAGETSTSTVYVNRPCPTVPPCPTCPPPTCHCPKAPPATASHLGGNGAQGPCPGSGYTCHDCLDGWFCPPPQTPALPAPCGFGWPCAHCDGGWFCVARPTTTTGQDTCDATGPATNGPGPTSSTTSISTSSISKTPSKPSSTQPAGASIPKSPGGASGWGYCGCWADQPDHRALNMESSLPNLGPLTNENCVKHCLGRGFVMAGTENGSDCYCGNFLNGTHHLDDDVCSTPCTGDPSQACGGNNALTCYSSDNEAHGWASTGPQPLPATVSPPEVVSMAVGGVAQTVVTQPAVVFPPPGADMGQLISQYGKTTQQPEGQMPSGMGENSAPNGNGGAAPGSPTSSDTCSGDITGQNTTPGSNPNPTSPGSNPTASPNGNSGVSASQGGNPGSTPGSGNRGTSPATPGGYSNSPVSSPVGSAGASPSVPSGPGQTTTAAPNGGPGGSQTCIPGPDRHCISAGSDGGQTHPSSGQGQGTAAPNPNNNTSGGGGANSGQTSPGQGQGTTAGNPTGNPAGTNDSTGQPSSGQGQGTTRPSGNGGASGQTSMGQGQGTTAYNPNSNPGQTSQGQGQGQATATLGFTSNPSQASSEDSQTTAAPGGNGVDPSPTSPSTGQGTAGSNPTSNPPGGGPNSGQGTMAPNPSDNPSQTSPAQGQGTAAPNPETSPLGGGNPPSTCTPGSTDSSCNPPNGGSQGSNPSGQSQGSNSPSNGGTTAANPTGSDDNKCTIGSNDPSCTSLTGKKGSLTPTSPGQGLGTTPSSNGGTEMPNASLNPSNGGQVSCSPGSNDPACNSPGNGGSAGSSLPNNGGPSQGQQPTTPNPTATNEGGTVTGESQPAASNPNTGDTGPNPAGTNTETPSFTFPPGQGPYGERPSPSLTTLKSMIAWKEADGEEGAPMVMLQPSMSRHGEPSSTPELEFEKSPTTTTSTSMLADPRWQRVRPVALW